MRTNTKKVIDEALQALDNQNITAILNEEEEVIEKISYGGWVFRSHILAKFKYYGYIQDLRYIHDYYGNTKGYLLQVNGYNIVIMETDLNEVLNALFQSKLNIKEINATHSYWEIEENWQEISDRRKEEENYNHLDKQTDPEACKKAAREKSTLESNRRWHRNHKDYDKKYLFTDFPEFAKKYEESTETEKETKENTYVYYIRRGEESHAINNQKALQMAENDGHEDPIHLNTIAVIHEKE